MAKTIYVQCSFCEGMMEVDVESGRIVQKWAPEERDANTDKMSAALKKLEEGKKKRESLFDRKKEELKDQKKKSESAFRQEVERLKREGITENPIKPFDLD